MYRTFMRSWPVSGRPSCRPCCTGRAAGERGCDGQRGSGHCSTNVSITQVGGIPYDAGSDNSNGGEDEDDSREKKNPRLPHRLGEDASLQGSSQAARAGRRQATAQARLSLPRTNVPNDLAVDSARHTVLQLEVHLGDSVVGKDRGVRDVTCETVSNVTGQSDFDRSSASLEIDAVGLFSLLVSLLYPMLVRDTIAETGWKRTSGRSRRSN